MHTLYYDDLVTWDTGIVEDPVHKYLNMRYIQHLLIDFGVKIRLCCGTSNNIR